MLLLFESHEAAPHGFSFHGFLQEAADVVASALGSGNIPGQVLSMHDLFGEQVEVHILVKLIQRIHLIPIFAKILDEFGIGFGKGLGMPDAHDGIHRVIGGDRIHADPLESHIGSPLGEIG